MLKEMFCCLHRDIARLYGCRVTEPEWFSGLNERPLLDRLLTLYEQLMVDIEVGGLLRSPDRAWLGLDELADVDYISASRQLLGFARKAQTQDSWEPLKQEAAFIEFQTSTARRDCIDDDSCRIVQAFISRIVGKKFDTVAPAHGPGVVAEESIIGLDKYSNLNAYYVPSPYRWLYTFGGQTFIGARNTVVKCSRGLFVPKEMGKRRFIAAEPCSLMWAQKAFQGKLYSRLKGTPLDPLDQTRNQRAARVASVDGNLATVDLKDASDSVTCLHVRKFLPRWLADIILQIRSTHVILPSGARVQVRSAATMGNALCFPVEALIFYGLARLACSQAHVTAQVTVYGDDVILPVVALDPFLRLLHKCGMRSNPRKTFYRSSFRESCGKDYYGGYDVTPTLWRGHFDELNRSPDQLSSVAGFLQNLGAEYESTRRFLSNLYPEIPTGPLGVPGTNGLGIEGSRLRWSRKYQRTEILTCSFVKRTRENNLADFPRLAASLLGDYRTEGESFGTVRVKYTYTPLLRLDAAGI